MLHSVGFERLVRLARQIDQVNFEVQQAFEREGYVQSEHATLEDGGSGLAGTLFLESDRAKSAEIAKVSDPALRAALEEKRTLEDQIAGLRLRKPSMPPDQYDQELEKLVTALAQKTRAIQQFEEKPEGKK